jgi:hypothetical protein
MAIVTRWVGLCCMLSAALVGACASSSKCDTGTPCSGVGGDGSAGTSKAEAGASSAGANTATAGADTATAGADTATAGADTATAGAAGSSQGGVGGTGSGGTISGSGAAGKPSGNAGAAQGGAGGTQGGGSCNGAQVVFLIQRSGALFEQPALDASYFGFVQAALVGDGSAAKPYSGKLPIGVSFLFATRDALMSVPAICPQLATTVPSLSFDGSLATAFTQSAAEHAALVTAKLKEEAPVPESIASAVASWSGASGTRHLVLITTAMPDTCTKFDGPCGIDATVNAVQLAKVAGVTTHVVGLGHDPRFNYYPDPESVPVETGYEEYLQQLANAGVGKPLGPPNVQKLQDYACGSATPAVLTATYSTTPGDAKYYQVKTATDAKTAVAEILASVCP